MRHVFENVILEDLDEDGRLTLRRILRTYDYGPGWVKN
jgi:hypothetical protein